MGWYKGEEYHEPADYTYADGHDTLGIGGCRVASSWFCADRPFHPFFGVWQLNLAKSRYSPGPPPKSGTLYIHGDPQNRRDSAVAIDPQGNPTAAIFTHIYDGQPHPVTGSPAVDAAAYTRGDANTLNYYRYMKAGNVVSTGTITVSQDGKTLTITGTGTNTNGQATNNITVYDKQ